MWIFAPAWNYFHFRSPHFSLFCASPKPLGATQSVKPNSVGGPPPVNTTGWDTVDPNPVSMPSKIPTLVLSLWDPRTNLLSNPSDPKVSTLAKRLWTLPPNWSRMFSPVMDLLCEMAKFKPNGVVMLCLTLKMLTLSKSCSQLLEIWSRGCPLLNKKRFSNLHKLLLVS